MTLRRHIEPFGYALTAVALWPLPLVNRLHAESSAVLALVAWGIAGWVSVGAFGEGRPFGVVLRGRLGMLIVPFALMTVPVVWAPNCDWLHGALLFVLFPVVTVVLSVAVAWALTGIGGKRPFGALLAFGTAVVLLGPLYDVGFHPQFYTYNHVFGGVLGPLYDEEIVWRGGLFAFRGLTLLWATLAWGIGTVRRGSRTTGLLVSAVTVLGLGGAYLASGRLGFNTSERDLSRALPVESFVGNTVLHMDSTIEPERRRRIESEAAYRYARLADLLQVEPDEPVQVWIYPDAETRGVLIGARVTSVAPVWLASPQVHVLDSQFEEIYPHELVHAFSRSFGMAVLNASPSVGLVEGLAVALEPPDGGPGPHEQVAAVRTEDSADRLAASLDPLGFWGGRGAVSYTTTGSFVRYLCDAYGLEKVEEVYASANFDQVFGKDPRELAGEWMEALDSLKWISVDARRRARSRFAVPSLFERRCPHYLPPVVRYRRESVRAWANRDTLQALRSAQRALATDPNDPATIAQWLRMQLRTGDIDAARRVLASMPDSLLTAGATIAQADILAIDGHAVKARERYADVRTSLPASSRESRASLTLRTLLAGWPDAMRVLVLGGLVRDRGDALDRIRQRSSQAEALAVAEALVRADGREFWQAATLMAGAEIPGSAESGISEGEALAFELQRIAWASELNEDAGDLRTALAYADSAGAFSEAVGDLAARRYWIDQAARLRHSLALQPVP